MRLKKCLRLAGATAVLATAYLTGPYLFHRALSSVTDAKTLMEKQSEWSRIVSVEPNALNGPNREAFSRYSANALRWFRVRGMVDPCCDENSVTGEWLSLFTYFIRGQDVGRPAELAEAPVAR